MSNAYFESMAVSSPQEASILANEYTWSILQVLRGSGSKGLTPREDHEEVEKAEKVTVSASKIYSILKRLYEIEWVHRHYDREAKAQRNTLAVEWGSVDIDEEYGKMIHNKMEGFIKKEMFPIFLDYFKKTWEELSKDEKNKEWLPSSGKASICKKCSISHEADELCDSLIKQASIEFFE